MWKYKYSVPAGVFHFSGSKHISTWRHPSSVLLSIISPRPAIPGWDRTWWRLPLSWLLYCKCQVRRHQDLQLCISYSKSVSPQATLSEWILWIWSCPKPHQNLWACHLYHSHILFHTWSGKYVWLSTYSISIRGINIVTASCKLECSFMSSWMRKNSQDRIILPDAKR